MLSRLAPTDVGTLRAFLKGREKCGLVRASAFDSKQTHRRDEFALPFSPSPYGLKATEQTSRAKVFQAAII